MPVPATATDHTAGIRFFEYTSAADPRLPAVPYAVLPADQHAPGPTRNIVWDLSDRLGCPWPATTPGLLAGFLRINAGETIAAQSEATSHLYYVIRGSGRSRYAGGEIAWADGDLFTLPSSKSLQHQAERDAALYYVHDQPLLSYLGATAAAPRFSPALYRRDRLLAEIARVRAEPGAANRNRMGVILGHADTLLTMTATHTLWALFNVLPAKAVQKPHRHNSVALDLCLSAEPGTYTLIAKEIDPSGNLIDPQRADWLPGTAFVTPPGLWHSHHNESGTDAMVLPIQDAGLHTWLRTLDIRFAR
ncbi:hypothetical protein LBMAG53_21470 [Planctomycetota bacterium]|nr:hypothetical protein LBMAG53_21470 [Planctomycetota bacterium]